MPTLTQGQSLNGVTSGLDAFTITTNHGASGRIIFVPTNPEQPPPTGSSRSFGPLAINQTFGPWGVPGTLTIYADVGTVTYNSSSPATILGAAGLSAGSTGITTNGGLTVGFGTVALNPVSANVTISPTGTGTVTINPATAGSMDNVTIGGTTRRTAGFSTLGLTHTDSSGTPGNVTNNSPKGRVAIAAGSNNVVVTTNVGVNTNSTVLAVINQASADATLTQIVRVVPASGSFTIYGNANATANTVVDFVIITA